MFVFAVIALALIVALIIGLKNQTAELLPKHYFKRVCAIGSILSLVIGLTIGNFHSHGFDIPWWMFTAASFLLILVFGAVIVLSFTMLKRAKNT